MRRSSQRCCPYLTRQEMCFLWGKKPCEMRGYIYIYIEDFIFFQARHDFFRELNVLPRKYVSWKLMFGRWKFLLERQMFRGYLSFRESRYRLSEVTYQWLSKRGSYQLILMFFVACLKAFILGGVPNVIHLNSIFWKSSRIVVFIQFTTIEPYQ